MPVFLERFVLTVLAAIFVGVIVLNPSKLDSQQRISLLVAVLAFAYFIGRTVHISHERQPQEPPSSVASPTNPAPHITGAATTSGDSSPANTGDGNTFDVGKPPTVNAKKK